MSLRCITTCNLTGQVLQISISKGGVPKRPVTDAMVAALGENFTTRGLDRRLWRIGQRWRVGGCVIEFTKIRTPCGALDVYGPAIKREIYDQRVAAGDPASPRWGMSGFYARVIEPGPVRAGSPISLESD